MMEVTLKKFKYVLDWFEVKDQKIETDDFEYFVMQCRGGVSDWYLMHYANENGKIRSTYEHDFNLNDPCDAVIKLGDKIKRFEHLHCKSIVKQLSLLMRRVDNRLSEVQS